MHPTSAARLQVSDEEKGQRDGDRREGDQKEDLDAAEEVVLRERFLGIPPPHSMNDRIKLGIAQHPRPALTAARWHVFRARTGFASAEAALVDASARPRVAIDEST